jgi:hypothetical protein
MFLATAAFAELTGYGVVESFAGGKIVIHLAKSTGTWEVDAKTMITGGVEVADWVYVEVETSGHVKVLRFEERATRRAGVIKSVAGVVLQIHSGNTVEPWNLTPTTVVTGVERNALQPGDEVGYAVYKNHNIATLKFIKSGVAVN